MILTTQESITKHMRANINDLRLINEHARPNTDTRGSAPRNLQQLGKLLQKRNLESGRSKESKELGSSWMENRGINIGTLKEKLRTVRQFNIKSQNRKKVEEESYFYFKSINLSNQDEYLNKATEYSMLSLFQTSMSNATQRKKVNQKIMAKLTGNQSGFVGQQQIRNMKVVCPLIRSPQKKNVYIQCVKRLIDSQQKFEYNSIKYFKEGINSQFWDIPFRQLQNVDPMLPTDQARAQILLNSLKLVEEQFNRMLPLHPDGISLYLNSNYLSRLGPDDHYIRDAFGSMWGKAFLLYRAGRKAQFYGLITENNRRQNADLLDKFFNADKMINDRHPTVFPCDSSLGEDIFKDQLVYCLRGEAKYSSQVLCSCNSLDIAWIFLRSVGILYETQSDKFTECRNLLISSYKSPQTSIGEMNNMMYLLAYDALLALGPNDLLDRDDYIHFLVAISHNPLLYDQSQSEIQQNVAQHVIAYIYELISQQRMEYMYYLMLLPPSRFISEASSIISAQLLPKFNWEFLEQRLDEQEYRNLVIQTLDKYAYNNKQFVAAAEMMNDLLRQPKKSLEYLLVMLVSNCLGKSKFAESELDKADRTAIKFMQFDDFLSKQYKEVFALLQENRRVAHLIFERDQRKLEEFLLRTRLIIYEGRITNSHEKMFQCLIAHRAFSVYFIFIRNLIRAAEISYLKKGKSKELREFQQRLLQSMKEIISKEEYREFSGQTAVLDVINYLKYCLWEIVQ